MKVLTTTLIAAALTTCGIAHAADNTDTLNQNVWLRLEAFRPNIQSNARIDRSQTGTAGTEIDFERDLGLSETKTLPTLLLGARFGGSWRAEFEYFHVSRDGSQTLGQILNVDDTTFPVSARVSTHFSSSVYRASIGYSFVKTPQAEFGAVLGAHVTKFDVSIEGDITAGGSSLAAQREEQNKTVPLPTIGLYGAFAFAPGWVTTGRVDLFKLKHGQYDGRLVNAQANLIYRVNQNIGVGLGYRYDDYKVSATRDDFRGFVDYKFRGPQVFVEAGF
jgi:opacity protein-like surface antigen